LGLSIAIAGGITVFTIIVIFSTIFIASEKIHEEGLAGTLIFENDDEILKTKTRIYGVNATVGSNLVNFTFANDGIEKLWNYDKFNLYITYDADIFGISTRVTEEFTYKIPVNILTAQSFLTPDFRIQRGVTIFGAGVGPPNDVTTAFIANVDQSKAFVRITNVVFSSGGLDTNTGGAGDRNNDDLGVRAEITAPNTITFTRLAGGEDADYRVAWEVWEYIGKDGGDNEFLVRDVIEVTTTGSAAVDTDIASIVVRSKVVPFITGLTSTETGMTWDDVNTAVWMVDGSVEADAVRVQRLGTAGTTITGVAIVEFTGNNWRVQNNIEIPLSGLAAGVNHIQPVSRVHSWDESFIVSSKNDRNGAMGLDEQGWNVWPNPTNLDELYFRMRSDAGAFTTEKIVVHIIHNFFLRVEHIDSLTGNRAEHPGTQPADNEADESITQVDDLTQTGIISTHDTDNGGALYPIHNWNYRLDADNNVEWYRGRDGQAGNFAMQIIQFPQSEWCTGGTPLAIAINEWTIDCINYDYHDPEIINGNEDPEILTKLQYPIFANGFLDINISSDNGQVVNRTIWVT